MVTSIVSYYKCLWLVSESVSGVYVALVPNFNVLELLLKENMGENRRNLCNIIPISKMGRKGSLGWSLRWILLSETAFPLILFRCMLFTILDSLLIFLSTWSSPFFSPFTPQKVFYLFTIQVFFFQAIDPQPSASINPALSVWSLRQIHLPTALSLLSDSVSLQML